MNYLAIFIILASSFSLTARASEPTHDLTDAEIEQLKILQLISTSVFRFRRTYLNASSSYNGTLAERAEKKIDLFRNQEYSEHFANELNEGYRDFLSNLGKCEITKNGYVDPESCNIKYIKTESKENWIDYSVEMKLNYESDKKLIDSFNCNYTIENKNEGKTDCIIETAEYGTIELFRQIIPIKIDRDSFDVWIDIQLDVEGKPFNYKFLASGFSRFENKGKEVYLDDNKFVNDKPRPTYQDLANPDLSLTEMLELQKKITNPVKFWPVYLVSPWAQTR